MISKTAGGVLKDISVVLCAVPASNFPSNLLGILFTRKFWKARIMCVRRCFIAVHKSRSACLWSTESKDFCAMLCVSNIYSRTTYDLCERTCAISNFLHDSKHKGKESISLSSLLFSYLVRHKSQCHHGMTARSYTTLCINTSLSPLSSTSSINLLLVGTKIPGFLFHVCGFEKKHISHIMLCPPPFLFPAV